MRPKTIIYIYMKKILLICALLFAVVQVSFSQNNLIEVVYLKNGSIIKGTIIEQIPNKSLKIETPDGSFLVCDMEDVIKITKEPVSSRKHVSTDPHADEYVRKGYKGFVDLGYTFGIGDYSLNRLEITTSHGFQFNPYIFLGGGAGIHYYHEADQAAMPLFVDFRVNFKKGSIVPFAGLKTGYTFLLSDDIGDLGFYCAPSIGFKMMTSHRMAVNLSLGYTVQLFDYYYSDHYHSYRYATENLSGISIKLGLEF